MPPVLQPILVVSYNDDTRAAMAAALVSSSAVAVPCSTFCEAEQYALNELFSGILVDLPSIIKSKGEEKIVAYTLVNVFPTLRVRAAGSLLIPMTLPGDASQDKSLNVFLTVTCPAFTPKKLRQYRRHSCYLSTLLLQQGEQRRGFTWDVSWGGSFIVDMQPEHFTIAEAVVIQIPEFGWNIPAVVQRIRPWGARHPPGIGISFRTLDQAQEEGLAGILKTRKEFDRDRLIA